MSGWLDERARNGGLDEVPLPASAGRLWLCGKHLVGPDPEAVLERTGAAVVVCLNEASELAGRYPDYVAWLGANAVDRAIWFPVHDLHAPPLEPFRVLLGQLQTRLARGEGVVAHCGAGIGRAGTLATAILLGQGLALADALATVAASRPAAGPQTAEQAAFLTAFATELA